MVLHSTRELDEGMSGKVISGIGGSFRRNTHYIYISEIRLNFRYYQAIADVALFLKGQ